MVVRPITAATALLYARIPFVKGNVEFADGERIRDGDAVLGFSLLLGGGRPHGELAGRYDDHLRTIGAVLELGEGPRALARSPAGQQAAVAATGY
jgi:hypothetical protein